MNQNIICTFCCHRGHTAGNCPRRIAQWHVFATLCAMATIAVVGMTGCSTLTVPPSKLLAPPARLMVPVSKAEAIKSGDDLVIKYLQLRKQFSRETSRLNSLQGYVRALGVSK